MKGTILIASGTVLFEVASATGVHVTSRGADPHCYISSGTAAVGQIYVVSAGGPPIGTAVGLRVTNANGTTTGSPLGTTPSGT